MPRSVQNSEGPQSLAVVHVEPTILFWFWLEGVPPVLLPQPYVRTRPKEKVITRSAWVITMMPK